METINGMTNEELVIYKKKLCEVMKAFIAFCDEHKLTYFAGGGTAIGAIRHQGIIPWDDDIDVYMIRPEYERFLSLRDTLKDSNYKIVDRSDHSLPTSPSAKFIDKNTTVWETEEQPFIAGVWVDIFVLDEAKANFSDERERQIAYDYTIACFNYNKSYNTLNFSYLLKLLREAPFSEIQSYIWSLLYHKRRKRKYLSQIIELKKELIKVKGDCYHLSGFTLPNKSSIFPKEWFSSYTEMKFEDFYIKVHNGVHQYLTTRFGDYMSPPPKEEQQITHSHYYINLNEGLSLEEVRKRIKQLSKTK